MERADPSRLGFVPFEATPQSQRLGSAAGGLVDTGLLDRRRGRRGLDLGLGGPGPVRSAWCVRQPAGAGSVRSSPDGLRRPCCLCPSLFCSCVARDCSCLLIHAWKSHVFLTVSWNPVIATVMVALVACAWALCIPSLSPSESGSPLEDAGIVFLLGLHFDSLVSSTHKSIFT